MCKNETQVKDIIQYRKRGEVELGKTKKAYETNHLLV